MALSQHSITSGDFYSQIGESVNHRLFPELQCLYIQWNLNQRSPSLRQSLGHSPPYYVNWPLYIVQTIQTTPVKREPGE